MYRQPNQKQSRLQHLASLSYLLADDAKHNQNLKYSIKAHNEHQPSSQQELAVRGRALTLEDVSGVKSA